MSDGPSGHNYDSNHVYPESKLTLQAKPVPPKTNYCAGVLSNGVLHLTPIHAVCRFKPSLGYIDAAEAAAAADSELKKEAHKFERLREGRMTEEEELEMEEEQYQRIKEEENKNQLQTVIMKVKRKEYGGGAGGAAGAAGIGGLPGGGVMRKQTFAFLKQLEEKEEWIPLKVHEQEVSTHHTHTKREREKEETRSAARISMYKYTYLSLALFRVLFLFHDRRFFFYYFFCFLL